MTNAVWRAEFVVADLPDDEYPHAGDHPFIAEAGFF